MSISRSIEGSSSSSQIEALKKEPCCSLECLNGGVCKLGPNGEESCLCAVGYTGNLCDAKIDYCDPNPCKNGGECVSLIGGHVCSCTTDSSGKDCEQGAISF